MAVDPGSLLTHFRVLQECATHDNRETRENCTRYVPVLDEEITEEEVSMAIHNMKANTASGDDGIPPGVYKSFNEQLITLLTMLFNHVLNTSEYPSSWSTGPIHKSGPTNDPTNYRGITLLNCMGKIFNAVLKNRLIEWAERTEILPESQFGFRKKKQKNYRLYLHPQCFYRTGKNI